MGAGFIQLTGKQQALSEVLADGCMIPDSGNLFSINSIQNWS